MPRVEIQSLQMTLQGGLGNTAATVVDGSEIRPENGIK